MRQLDSCLDHPRSNKYIASIVARELKKYKELENERKELRMQIEELGVANHQEQVRLLIGIKREPMAHEALVSSVPPV